MGKKLKKAAKVVGATAALALVGGLAYSHMSRPDPDLTRRIAEQAYRNYNADIIQSNPSVGRRVAYNNLAAMGSHLVSRLAKPKIYPSSGGTMEEAFGYDWA